MDSSSRQRDPPRVIATAADALWVVDRDGYIRFLNPAEAAILGYADPAELVGRPSHATMHYKHADRSPYPVECRVVGQFQDAGRDH
jgi:PAS domain S-box-containing protein